jgi:hypothetical protein
MTKKYIILVLVLFISNTSFAQLSDLCGIWFGHNYACSIISADGTIKPVRKTEVLFIKHNGAHTVATKIIGDDCVTAGQISWQGNYNENPFKAKLTLGHRLAPGSSTTNIRISVIDATHIETSKEVKFRKATCQEIHDLNLNLELYNIDCIDCDVDRANRASPYYRSQE